MIHLRKSDDRGRFNHGWLVAAHSFSFGDYHDPRFMGFRSLRVINEDIVSPGEGFPTHGHQNMEIVTYILEGALEHKDSMGNGSIIKPGDVQYMSAGSGVRHSEFNASKSEKVHLLQIWLMPNQNELKPQYGQSSYSIESRTNQLKLIVSESGSDGSIAIRQDVLLFASLLHLDSSLVYPIKSNRHLWIQLATGSIEVNGIQMSAGDGLAVKEEQSLVIKGTSAAAAEFLLFDLN